MAKPTLDIAAAEEALQATKDRRTSTLQQRHYEQEEDPPKVDSVWDISCPEQVTQLAQDNPAHFWNWPLKITKERDDFRIHTQSLQAMHQQYEELEAKFEALKADHHESEQSLADAESNVRSKALDFQQQYRELEEAALEGPSTHKGRMSSKQPNPPIFTDGKDPTWDDWSAKMREKLRANADHYPTEDSKVVYVLSRLGGLIKLYIV